MLLRLVTIKCITVILLNVCADLASGTKHGKDGCKINVPVDGIYVPIVIDEQTQQVLVPELNKKGSSSQFAIEKNQEIRISCEREYTESVNGSHFSLLLTCIRGTKFLERDADEIVLPNGIECSNPKNPTPIIYRNGKCYRNSTNFDVNFLVESSLRKFYSVCMDEETFGTLYSSSYLDGERMANEKAEKSNRPSFKGHEIYPFEIPQAYTWKNAEVHLINLIGSESVTKYFPTDQHHFSKGHLFPNADGVKMFEKHATFFYINTVPQWQILNGGNWKSIEQDVRNMATNYERTLEVITGAYQVTTLPDSNNNDVEIWLARDNSGNLRLPVPRFVWKVVHDPSRDAAVAIVQVNNPWIKSDPLCNDVCSDLPWIRSSSFHNPRKGYSYCCDVNELRRVIKYIPQVQYKNLLGARQIDDEADIDSGIESGEDDTDSEDDDEYRDYSYIYSGKKSSSSGGNDNEGYARGTVRNDSTVAVNKLVENFANINLGTK